jgi:hypothetical protein
MGSSFREEEHVILNPKGKVVQDKEFFSNSNPHTTAMTVERPFGDAFNG